MPKSKLARTRLSTGLLGLLLGLGLLSLASFYISHSANSYTGIAGLYDRGGRLIGRDFRVYWTASVLTLSGKASAIFDYQTFEAQQDKLLGPPKRPSEAATSTSEPDQSLKHPWLYPPHALFFVLPLGLLSYFWAYVLWSLGTLFIYLLAVTHGRGRDLQQVALILAPATFMNLLLGQNGFLSAALLLGGLRLIDRRPLLAGVLLGLLCFKPQLGLLIPVALAAARLWRPFLSAAATVTFLILASVLAFGVDSWLHFFEFSATYQSQLLGQETGDFLKITVTPFMAGRILGLGEAARYVLFAIIALGALAGVFVTFRKTGDREPQAVVLLAAVFLVSPYGYVYDLPLLMGAVLWAFQRTTREGFLPGELTILTLTWFLPFIAITLNPLDLPVGPLVLGLFFTLQLIKANGWLPGPALASAKAR